MAGYTHVFTDKKTTNWFKAFIALKITKEGLANFVNTEIKNVQTHVGGGCGNCSIENVLDCPTPKICNTGNFCHFHKSKQYWKCRACVPVRKNIISIHRYGYPSWKNTNPKKWKTNAWHIAKCFLPPDGYADISSVQAETDLPVFEQPKVDTKQLKIVIHGTPDKTERFFFDSNRTFYADKRPSLRHTILVNANGSSNHYAGRIVLADVDGGEVFAPLPRFNALGNSRFSLKRLTSTSDVSLANYTTKRYRSLEAYDVDFEYSPDLQGNMTLDFIAKNTDDSYTPSITINLYVMENPCIHGQCHHPTLGYAACENPERSLSFSGFECICEPGYTSSWCQIEIDECQSNPCSSMYDCEDLVNDYQCNINIPKLLAVIGCPLIVLIVLGTVLRRIVVNLRYRKVSRSRIGLMEINGQHPLDNTFNRRFDVGQIPKPGHKVNIPLHCPDDFDNMIKQLQKHATMTDVQT